jgi:hypothetical protein
MLAGDVASSSLAGARGTSATVTHSVGECWLLIGSISSFPRGPAYRAARVTSYHEG